MVEGQEVQRGFAIGTVASDGLIGDWVVRVGKGRLG